MQTPTAISARGLRKSYGTHLVLDGIDLEVAEGSTFALLGPNGSGKTTTVQVLSTLIPSDGGDIRVGGFDLTTDQDEIRRRIGVTGQFSAVDGFLTGEENLQLMADLHHVPAARARRRIHDLLERFDIADAAKKTPAAYSGGMRRRLDIAMTLVGSPRIIFLDEPTAGLDPRSRRGTWEIVRELIADGVTIFLTTQYLEEADQLADRIAVLDQGRIIAAGTSSQLKQLVPGGHLRLQFADAGALANAATSLDRAVADRDTLALHVPSDGSPRAVWAVLDRLERASIVPTDLSIHTPDLDDVFLALTGQQATAKTTTTEDFR